MIPSVRQIVLLDACVLYPAPMRDLLLHVADSDLYAPKWTDIIHQEWTRNLLQNRSDLNTEQLQRTVRAMNAAFPDATVTHFETLIDSILLPDPDDAHVLAAAIRCRANLIVTANLKDFPVAYLSQYDLDVQHPDQFIGELIDLNPGEVWQAFQKQVANLKRPPKTAEQVLDILRRTGLEMTANRLRAMF